MDKQQKNESAPDASRQSGTQSSSLKELNWFLSGPIDFPHLALVGLFILALFYTLYFARAVFQPIVLALLLTLVLKPVVRSLVKLRISEPFGALIVIGALLGTVSGGFVLLSKPATEWMARTPQGVRHLENKIREIIKPAFFISRAAQRVEKLATPQEAEKPTEPGEPQKAPQKSDAPSQSTPKVELRRTSLADTLVSYTTSFLAGIIETTVLLYFMLASGDRFRLKLLKVLPSRHNKMQAVEIGQDLEQKISHYLFTIAMINSLVGVVAGFVMFLLGMPNPALWGVLAGLLNFMPYIGPVIASAVFTLVALLVFDSAGHVLLVPFCYLALHGVESNFITPTVVGQQLTLNPVIIFISLIFWIWFWGIPGALIAVPVLMTVKIFCDHIKPLSPIGEFLSR